MSKAGILSASSGSAFHFSRVAFSSAACGRAGAATVSGSCSMIRSCIVVPALARKPTMRAGASVVPMARTRDRVPSAELDSSSGTRSSIM